MTRWRLPVALLLLLLLQPRAASADVQWLPTGPGQPPSQARVQGDVTSQSTADGRELRGWVVDAFSATRADQVEISDTAGRQLGHVESGGFERRPDVALRYGSSAYSLSGFRIDLPDPPRTVVIRAHLGWLGWWQTQTTLDVPRHAQLVRLECVSADAVEVELTSAEPFPVRDALVELQIGDGVTSTISRYADDGDLHTVIFTLTADQFAAVSPTDWALVRFNPGGPNEVWQVDAIDPSAATGCET